MKNPNIIIRNYLHYLCYSAPLEELEAFLGYRVNSQNIDTLKSRVYDACARMPKSKFDKLLHHYEATIPHRYETAVTAPVL